MRERTGGQSSIAKSKYKKPKIARFSLVTLHAVWLVILTIFLQYTSLVRPDEIPFFKGAAIFKKLILRDDKRPLPDSVLFLDMSNDLSLLEQSKYPGASIAVKDRRKLAKLFSILQKHPDAYKFVLCDILMSDRAPDDAILKDPLEHTPRVITSSVLQGDTTVRPVFSIKFGYVNYSPAEASKFVKMPIYLNDTMKSLPATLCEMAGNHRFERKNKITYIDGHPAFNYVIPDFYYRPANLNSKEILPLGRLTLFSDSTILRIIKNKWIVIGDFSADTHATYLGGLPGSFILFNVYATLATTKAATISPLWLVLLFVIYFFLSYRIVIDRKSEIEVPQSLAKLSFLKKVFVKFISFLGICFLLNTVSYFAFGIFISMLYMATYLTAFEFMVLKRRTVLFKVKRLFKRQT